MKTPAPARSLTNALRRPRRLLLALLLISLLAAPALLAAYPLYLLFTVFLYVALRNWGQSPISRETCRHPNLIKKTCKY